MWEVQVTRKKPTPSLQQHAVVRGGVCAGRSAPARACPGGLRGQPFPSSRRSQKAKFLTGWSQFGNVSNYFKSAGNTDLRTPTLLQAPAGSWFAMERREPRTLASVKYLSTVSPENFSRTLKKKEEPRSAATQSWDQEPLELLRELSLGISTN